MFVTEALPTHAEFAASMASMVSAGTSVANRFTGNFTAISFSSGEHALDRDAERLAPLLNVVDEGSERTALGTDSMGSERTNSHRRRLLDGAE